MAITDRDHWRTPEWILSNVRKVADDGVITLDPCGQDGDLVNPLYRLRGPKYHEDGLIYSWAEHKGGLIFVNPPYSRGNIPAWVDKCVKEAKEGCEIIALLPGDYSTSGWQDAANTASAICLLYERVRFIAPPGIVASSPTGPSSLVYWVGGHLELKTNKFRGVFKDLGMCVRIGDTWGPYERQF